MCGKLCDYPSQVQDRKMNSNSRSVGMGGGKKRVLNYGTVIEVIEVS